MGQLRQRFYRVDESGSAHEVSTQQFLRALMCEQDEDGVALPDGYNRAVSSARRRFDEHLARLNATRSAAPSLPPAQRYVLSRLRDMHGSLESTEDRRRRRKYSRLGSRAERSTGAKAPGT